MRRSEVAQTFLDVAASRSEVERAHLAGARDAWQADPGSAAACRAFYEAWYEREERRLIADHERLVEHVLHRLRPGGA